MTQLYPETLKHNERFILDLFNIKLCSGQRVRFALMKGASPVILPNFNKNNWDEIFQL